MLLEPTSIFLLGVGERRDWENTFHGEGLITGTIQRIEVPRITANGADIGDCQVFFLKHGRDPGDLSLEAWRSVAAGGSLDSAAVAEIAGQSAPKTIKLRATIGFVSQVQAESVPLSFQLPVIIWHT